MTDAKLQEEIENAAHSFEKDGYGVVRNFLTNDQVDSLRNEAKRLIKQGSRSESRGSQVFGNYFTMKGGEFIESGNKICYFYKEKASELQLAEGHGLTKIAHALHCLNPVFKEVSCSQQVKAVFKAIGFLEPTIIQSVMILKNAKVGLAYAHHQDASLLYCEPPYNNLVGMWIALDDATPENGCLEFIPGSHKGQLRQRFVRSDKPQDGENVLEWTGQAAEHDQSKLVKVPVKRGDMILIHGLVVHGSAANTSDKPRWAYSFHSYDKARSVFSDKNWIQDNGTFLTLYKS